MKAAVMVDVGKIEIEQRPIPKPRDGELLINVKSIGVCGSDVHYFIEGKIGDFIVKPPFLLGHECSGEVVEVGMNVKNFKPGDRVAMEPGVPCGKCDYCRNGRYNLCPEMTFWATPPIDGVFCEYVVHPDYLVHPLSKQISYQEGSLLEPLAVGLAATQRSCVKPGMVALVLGSGPIGLLVLKTLLLHGVTKIIMMDIFDFRLEKAKELGATMVINSKDVNIEKSVLAHTEGEGVDIVYETAGNIKTIQNTLRVVKNGGKVILVGFPPQNSFEIDVINIIAKELDILGIWRYANVFKGSVELLNSGKVNLNSLITHQFNLEKTEEALRYVYENKERLIKAVINV